MASLSKVAQEVFEKLVASGKTEQEAMAEIARQGLDSAPRTLADAISSPMGSDLMKPEVSSSDASRAMSSPTETSTDATSATSPTTLLDKLSSNKGKVGLGLAGAGAATYGLTGGPEAPTVPTEPMTVSETEPGVAPSARMGAGSSLSASVKGREVPTSTFRQPGSLDSLMRRLDRERASPDVGRFQEEISAAGQAKTGAEVKREEARRQTEMGQLFDILGRGLTQIGAAAQGLRSNVDLSNIAQKSVVDWEARRKEISDDYDRRIAEADKRIDKATRGMEREEAKAESSALERRKLLTEDYFDKWKAYRDEVLQSQRLANEIEKKVLAKGEAAAAGDLKAIQSKLAKEEARQTNRRLLDTQIDSLKASQGTSDWDKELQKTKEMFAKLNTDVEAGDKAFAPALPSGFWENLTGEKSIPDVDALKKYNRGQIALGDTLVKQYQGILGSGTIEGTIPAAPATQPPAQPPTAGLVERKTADGRTALFDPKTKQFVRYKD